MTTLFLLLAATVLWGFWGYADKNALHYAHPFTVFWMYCLPYAVLIPVWYWLGNTTEPETNHHPQAFKWAIAASLASLTAFVLILLALKGQPASLVIGFTAAYPMVTTFFVVMAGMEQMSWQKLVGIGLVLVGLVVLQTSP